ncbi:MAG: hypothetical protein Q4E02_01745 [Lagierella massiliensis]|nr:hypothetical protein [Lagierella massiliensis]
MKDIKKENKSFEEEREILPSREDEENIKKGIEEKEKVRAKMEILRDNQQVHQNLNR